LYLALRKNSAHIYEQNEFTDNYFFIPYCNIVII
jgi:hypothetical protein